jgi:hypothetical protein
VVVHVQLIVYHVQDCILAGLWLIGWVGASCRVEHFYGGRCVSNTFIIIISIFIAIGSLDIISSFKFEVVIGAEDRQDMIPALA